MRARTWILCGVSLLACSFSLPTLRAAEAPACGASDLLFGCTKTDEAGRLRAGCGVRDGKRFFASAWRIYDMQSENVLKEVAAGPEGIALIEIPRGLHWFILEGEMVCTTGTGEISVPYRFLGERTGDDKLRQRVYTPESLMATGNWNAETQLHYGEFRGRSLRLAPASPE